VPVIAEFGDRAAGGAADIYRLIESRGGSAIPSFEVGDNGFVTPTRPYEMDSVERPIHHKMAVTRPDSVTTDLRSRLPKGAFT
jgi:hypothetical protein